MPAADNALFTPAELAAWLHQPVADEDAWMVEKVVWGWLSTPLAASERPASPSDELKSWAVELGGLAYTNPEGLKTYWLESERSTYDNERREEILTRASAGTGGAAGALSPRGSFPSAPCYPDPARW